MQSQIVIFHMDIFVHFILKVHAVFSSCTQEGWNGEGPCGCGIAVRVENSLFAYRTCKVISYRYSKPLLQHEVVNHICDNRHMVVDIGDPWTKVFNMYFKLTSHEITMTVNTRQSACILV